MPDSVTAATTYTNDLDDCVLRLIVNEFKHIPLLLHVIMMFLFQKLPLNHALTLSTRLGVASGLRTGEAPAACFSKPYISSPTAVE